MHNPVERQKQPAMNVRAPILLACVCTYLLFASAILMAKDPSHCTCVFLPASLSLAFAQLEKTLGFLLLLFGFEATSEVP